MLKEENINKMSTEEILVLLNEKIEIYQRNRRFISLQVLQTKYKVSFDTLLIELGLLNTSYCWGKRGELSEPFDLLCNGLTEEEIALAKRSLLNLLSEITNSFVRPRFYLVLKETNTSKRTKLLQEIKSGVATKVKEFLGYLENYSFEELRQDEDGEKASA